MSEVGFIDTVVDTPTRRTRQGASKYHSLVFAISKHGFDLFFVLISLPIVVFTALSLLLLNPFFNPGPLFYSQKRMGKNHQPFIMYKFRTMLPEGDNQRCHESGVEEDRITLLGGVLRRLRIDELPNLLNVLRREMSVIGPRPDSWNHAVEYAKVVPNYDARHLVRPGITGLAQVEMGYAEGIEQTEMKAKLDRCYIECYGFRQEARIIFKTVKVVLTGFGAR